MIYSLTDKLKFDDNPQIEIKGKVLTVKSDAMTVLKLMDIVETDGEIAGAVKAADLLFSAKDRKVLDSLGLSMEDFSTVLSTAMQLAVGEDPDEEAPEE